jgi:hypothetical protein
MREGMKKKPSTASVITEPKSTTKRGYGMARL